MKKERSHRLTQDLTLFDIKKMKGDYKRDYYRLRKGKKSIRLFKRTFSL